MEAPLGWCNHLSFERSSVLSKREHAEPEKYSPSGVSTVRKGTNHAAADNSVLHLKPGVGFDRKMIKKFAILYRSLCTPIYYGGNIHDWRMTCQLLLLIGNLKFNMSLKRVRHQPLQACSSAMNMISVCRLELAGESSLVLFSTRPSSPYHISLHVSHQVRSF